MTQFSSHSISTTQVGVETVDIEPALVDAVLDQVPAQMQSDSPEPGASGSDRNGHGSDESARIATPLLQLVMETIWNQERAEGSWVMRLVTLEKLEGVERIVDIHLAKALSKLTEEERQIAIDCFDHLVTPSGGKIAEAVPNLARRTSHDEESVAGVLARLDPERILRPVPAAPGLDPMRFRRFEIFHDVLAGAINRSIAARDEERLEREKREAEERARTDRSRRSDQIGGPRSPSPSWPRALVAVVIAIVAWRSAVGAKDAAHSRQLAASAMNDMSSDPQLSLSLALQAVGASDLPVAEQALHQAYEHVQVEASTRADGIVFDVAFSPNGQFVAAVTSAGDIDIWGIGGGADAVTAIRNPSVTAVAFSPNGRTLVAVGSKGVADVYPFDSGRVSDPRTFSIDNDERLDVGVNDVVFEPNGAGIATVDEDGHLCLYALDGSPQVPCSPAIPNPNFASGQTKFLALNTVSISGDGSRLVTSSYDPAGSFSQVAIWSAADLSSPVSSVPVPAYEQIEDASVNPDGTEVATASGNGTARVWDVSGATPTEVGDLDTVGFTSLALFTQNGDVVTSNDDGQTTVWDPSTDQQLTNLDCDCGVVYAVAVDPSGAPRIVTGSQDELLRLWDSDPRQLERSSTVTNKGVGPAVFVPGSDVIATGTDDDQEAFWNVDTNAKTTISGVESASFAKPRGYFVVANLDGGVSEWSFAQGSEPSQFTKGNGIDEVAVSPNGRYMAVASGSEAFIVPYPNGYGAEFGNPKVVAGSTINGLAFNKSGTEVLASYQGLSQYPGGRAVMWPTKVLASKPDSGHPKARAQCVFTAPHGPAPWCSMLNSTNQVHGSSRL